MTYSNARTLSLQYDNRLRVTQWDIPGVMGWNYAYNYFGENTGRITYAQNRYDATLDRSYDYDNVGRLIEARTGSEARGHLIGQGGMQDGPYAQSYRYDQTGNMWYRVGWGGGFTPSLEQWPNYVNNRLTTNPWTEAAMTYDAAGNLTNDGYQTYTYDATGQQVSASLTNLTQSYDGDGLRAKKVEGSVTTYYLRSSVLGGQVVCELNNNGGWNRGYVYLGGQLLAVQYAGVNWVHQDPETKSQRITNSSGAVISTIDLDPWGGETARSSNQAFQPHRYTTYERDANGGDEAMMRRYTGKWHRFTQPDPYDGSYDLSDPQSFNRYAYVQNDPVNFVDPTGLDQDPSSPPSTTHIDPATGQSVSVPGIGASVTIGFTQVFGPASTLGGDAHSQLLMLLLHAQAGGASQDPAPPCTFNINISGVSGQQLIDMQNELSRIFASANFNVVFGQPAQANAGSMNLVVAPQFTGASASRNPIIGILGVTQVGSGESQVNSNHIFLTTNTARTIVSRPETFASYGTMYGRIGAHEVITHGFLGRAGHPYDLPHDVRNASDRNTLVARYNHQWSIGAQTAQELRAKCP